MFIFVSVFAFIALPSPVCPVTPSQFPLGQSANPGLGVNPRAEGATASVPPNSGPNG